MVDDKEPVRKPFNLAMLSGRIKVTYPPNNDKVGTPKIAFTLSLTPSGKQGKQSYANITTYDLDIAKLPYFKIGIYVYCQCKIVRDGFYILDEISRSPFDCYREFIDQVYKEDKIQEDEI